MSHPYIPGLVLAVFAALLAVALWERDRTGIMMQTGNLIWVGGAFLVDGWPGVALMLVGVALVFYGAWQGRKQRAKPEPGR